MKTIINLICFLFSFSIPPAFATITFVSPTASSSFVQCTTIKLTTNTSEYVNNGVAELYKGGVLIRSAFAYFNSPNVVNNISGLGLQVGNDYQIKVYDQYNTSNYGWSSYFSITQIPPPSAIFLSLSGYNFFEINWPTVNGATGYRVDVSITSDFLNILPSYNNYDASGSASGGLYITGLNSGATYYTRIRSTSSCGTSDNSSVFTTTLPTCSPPSAPIANTATSVGSTSFTASWNAVSGATNGYDLIVRRTGSSPVTYSVSGTSYTVGSLYPSSGYSYYVVAKGCSNSSSSNIVYLTTIALGIPVINGRGGDGNEVWFSWKAVVGATGYQAHKSYNSNFSNPVSMNLTTETTANFDSNWCTDEYYRVRAKSATGTYSGWSETIYKGVGGGCRMRTEDDSSPTINNMSFRTDESQIEIYPNPTEKHIKIKMPYQIDGLELQVYDYFGNKIITPIIVKSGEIELDAANMLPGVYILELKSKSYNNKIRVYKK
jgi:hypothetical protein